MKVMRKKKTITTNPQTKGETNIRPALSGNTEGKATPVSSQTS